MVSAAACAPPPESVPEPGDGTRVAIERLAAELARCCPSGAEARVRGALEQMAEHPPPEPVLDGLAGALTSAVNGRTLSGPSGERIAWHLYELVNGGFLDARALEVTLNAMEHEMLQQGADLPAVVAARRFAARAARESRTPRADWW